MASSILKFGITLPHLLKQESLERKSSNNRKESQGSFSIGESAERLGKIQVANLFFSLVFHLNTSSCLPAMNKQIRRNNYKPKRPLNTKSWERNTMRACLPLPAYRDECLIYRRIDP
nr:hypothetical protein [Tanacetum cinerariifolium]